MTYLKIESILHIIFRITKLFAFVKLGQYLFLHQVTRISDYDKIDYYKRDELVDVILDGNGNNVRSFAYCTNLKTVTATNNIYTIERYAFAGCQKLTMVSFPYVSVINEYVFFGCISLIEIKMPPPSTIGDYAFVDCKLIYNLDFNRCALVGKSAFENVNLNCSIVFASNPVTIKENAFKGTKITEVHILKENSVINSFAFFNLSTLKTVELDNCNVEIYAFLNCRNINEVILHSPMMIMQSGCFDKIQVCVYYFGTEDFFHEIDILIINRIYKAVFVSESYPFDTFCGIPVSKNIDGQCPSKRLLSLNHVKVLNRKTEIKKCDSQLLAPYFVHALITIKSSQKNIK